MPNILATRKVEGNIKDIYDLISDMTSYPVFMPDLISVDLLEKRDNITITRWLSNVAGRKIQWTEMDTFYPDLYRIDYEQIQGDLKYFRGYWQLTEETDGINISLYVDFEFGIPMIAGMLNPLLKKTVRENSENMLRCIDNKLSST